MKAIPHSMKYLVLFCLLNCSMILGFAQGLKKNDIAEFISRNGYVTMVFLDSLQVTDPNSIKVDAANPIVTATLIKLPSTYSLFQNAVFLETQNFILQRDSL